MSVRSLLFSFEGRIRRRQWWVGQAGVVAGIIAILLATRVIVTRIYGPIPEDEPPPGELALIFDALILSIYAVLFWTGAALGAKRYHDLGRSGWWCLLVFLPLGNIWMLIELAAIDGARGRNKFGLSPKGASGEELGNVFT